MRQLRAAGFTLIELMIVVAVIGILAAVAIPKFADLITKSKESNAKKQLGTFRAALSIYYSDSEGVHAQDRDALVPKYLDEIPEIYIPTQPSHRPSSEVRNTIDDWAGQEAWYYDNTTGILAINCTHPDTRGTTWSTW